MMKMGKGGWLLVVLSGLCILGMAFFLLAKKPSEEIKRPPETRVPVQVMTLSLSNVADIIDLPGKIEPFVEATLATEKAGQVVELKVDKGDYVRAGQRLLLVDDVSWSAAVHRAEVDFREAEKEMKRQKRLVEAGGMAVSDFDRTKQIYELAQIALIDSRKNLDRCQVLSPIDGIVADRMFDLGEFAGEGAPAFNVVNINPVKLAILVPERDVVSIQKGLNMTFTVAALGGRSFTGQVSFVSPVAAKDGCTFLTELLVANSDLALKGGMLAKVQFLRQAMTGVLAVPLTAVVLSQGEHVVYIVRDGRAERRIVKVDAIVGPLAVVGRGLKVGEQVVVEGQRALGEGMPVQVVGGAR